MKAKIEIEEVKEDNVSLLIALIRELAEYEDLLDEVEVTEETMADSLFRLKAAEALLVYADGELAGYCIYFHNFSTFLGRAGIYVEDIYVRPSHRRKGIGQAVFIHMARLAEQRNCGRLEFAVLDWNEPALKFYDSLGAKLMKEWQLHRFVGDSLRQLAKREL